jgi:hypothetical protein
MEHDLNDFAPDEIMALAERIAQRAHDRSQAQAVATALEALRRSIHNEALAPNIARALRVVVDASPSAWLEYAVEQRLLDGESL